MQQEYFGLDDLRWKNPVSIVLSGPSNSGKSTICFNLIRHREHFFMSNTKLKVLYHLPARHKIYVPPEILADRGVTFHEGNPDFSAINEPCIIFMDDLGSEINADVVEAYTRYSHHKQISVVLIVHNIFQRDSKNYFRTISLNTSVFFLTNNPRDRRQISTLASQIMPTNSKLIVDAYNDAISTRSYGYLCIDCSQNTKNKLRLRTNLFPEDPSPRNIIYTM
jgi:cytidylate kinase